MASQLSEAPAATAMKADFVNPFILAAMEALESVIHSTPAPGPLAVRSALLTTQQLSVLVAITGQLEGQALYGMSLVTANRIAAAKSGVLEMTFNDAAANTLLEVGKLIADQAASLLSSNGYQCQLAAPELLQGRDLEICPSSPVLVLPLLTDCGKIEINVALGARTIKPAPASQTQPDSSAPSAESQPAPAEGQPPPPKEEP
jgi:chemotaxis protein CheX